MPFGRPIALLIASALVTFPASAAAQQSDPNGYCLPQNSHFDPQDVRRPDAPPIALPPGFARRRISVAGFNTTVIERGPRDSEEAVVFMHGNPGSSLDFIGLLRAVPEGTRVIAFDILGFGAADKPYDFPYDLASSRPVLDRAFRELGIERMHLVGHDIGSVVGVDYAARNPHKLASAVLIAGGILIGYVDHHFARIWKTPRLGEESMRGVDREGFIRVIQAHNPRPLPREFLDRNYDYFDRGTRCAILKIYRAMPNIDRLSRQRAAALRPHDKPALVIWGDRDPFLPQHLAYGNREGFPRAAVHVFANSGHWPFVDEEARTVRLMNAFLARHVGGRSRGCAEPAGRISGRRVGPAALGRRRSANRSRFPRYTVPRRSIDRFCLGVEAASGSGIRPAASAERWDVATDAGRAGARSSPSRRAAATGCAAYVSAIAATPFAGGFAASAVSVSASTPGCSLAGERQRSYSRSAEAESGRSGSPTGA